MKGKIFWAGAALLCCLDKNLSREQREERLLILFAAKRTASLLLLPLIVILCRPAQDTGDPAPSVLLGMEKQQQESQPSWMIMHFITKKQQQQQKLHVLKEMRRYFTHPKPCTAPGSIKCRHSGVNLLYKQPKLEWNCSLLTQRWCFEMLLLSVWEFQGAIFGRQLDLIQSGLVIAAEFKTGAVLSLNYL